MMAAAWTQGSRSHGVTCALMSRMTKGGPGSSDECPLSPWPGVPSNPWRKSDLRSACSSHGTCCALLDRRLWAQRGFRCKLAERRLQVSSRTARTRKGKPFRQKAQHRLRPGFRKVAVGFAARADCRPAGRHPPDPGSWPGTEDGQGLRDKAGARAPPAAGHPPQRNRFHLRQILTIGKSAAARP